MKYISPTSYNLFYRDREEFVFTYILGYDRRPQTAPMAIGSAFDCFIKNYLQMHLDMPIIHYWNMEPEHEEIATELGSKAFQLYKNSGALYELIEMLGDGVQFETRILKEVWGIPLLGLPDIHWPGVVLDWKVNGWMAKRPPSPRKGYLRDRWTGRKTKKHPQYGINFEEIEKTWATQLCFYSWLLEESDPLVGIEQVIPERVVSYRGKISQKFKDTTKSRILHLWERVTTGWYLDTETKQESDDLMGVYKDKDFVEVLRA